LVLGLSGLATIAMMALIASVVMSGHLSSGEQLSRELAWAIIDIYGVPYTLFMLPALVLGLLNRWLPFALALCILSVPALIIVFHYA
jgi:hypothetical protein